MVWLAAENAFRAIDTRESTLAATRCTILQGHTQRLLDGSCVGSTGFDVRNGPLLCLDCLGPVLQIVRLKIPYLHARYEEWCLSEQVLHLLKRASGRLGKNSPEEDRVREVTNLSRGSATSYHEDKHATYNEEEVVLVANVGHGNWGDLTDQSVESE